MRTDGRSMHRHCAARPGPAARVVGAGFRRADRGGRRGRRALPRARDGGSSRVAARAARDRAGRRLVERVRHRPRVQPHRHGLRPVPTRPTEERCGLRTRPVRLVPVRNPGPWADDPRVRNGPTTTLAQGHYQAFSSPATARAGGDTRVRGDERPAYRPGSSTGACRTGPLPCWWASRELGSEGRSRIWTSSLRIPIERQCGK